MTRPLSSQKVLIVRPQPGADKTAERVRDAGFDPCVEPLSRIEILNYRRPDGEFSAIAATSAAAFDILTLATDSSGPHDALLRLPLFVVGEATAKAGRMAGFTDIHIADGSSQSLLALLTDFGSEFENPVLYLRGKHISFDLIDGLHKADMAGESWATYEAMMIPELSDDVLNQLKAGKFTALLLHSARMARHFTQLCENSDVDLATSQLRILCLSEAICSTLPPILRKLCEAAKSPNDAALIRLLSQP